MRWGSFSVYGVKLHLLCATNHVPISYELTAASAADVPLVLQPHFVARGIAFHPASVVTAACIGLPSSTPL